MEFVSKKFGFALPYTPASLLVVDAIIDKVNGLVNAYLKSDTGRQQLDKMGMTPIGGTPEELKAHLERESAKWGPIIKEANISLQ